MESFPYRVVTSLWRPGRECTGSGFLEVLRPFDDVTRTSPDCSGSSSPAAVPLSGSLNLSAVYWHVRALRPCLMPLPSWGSPFRALLAGIACASRRRLLPCSSPPPYLKCDALDRSSGFHRRPRLWRGGLDPPGARTSFPSLSSTRFRAQSARLRTLSRAGLRRLPRRPGSHAPESPRSGGFGCFEAFLPPRVRA